MSDAPFLFRHSSFYICALAVSYQKGSDVLIVSLSCGAAVIIIENASGFNIGKQHYDGTDSTTNALFVITAAVLVECEGRLVQQPREQHV